MTYTVKKSEAPNPNDALKKVATDKDLDIATLKITNSRGTNWEITIVS